MNDPLGRHRFRDHLLDIGESTGELDMWQDLSYHARLLEQLQNHSEALHGEFAMTLTGFFTHCLVFVRHIF